MQSNLANALLSVIWSLPVLLASVAGCVVCLMNLARYSRPAILGLAAFVILLLSALIGAVPWWYLMPTRGSSDGVYWAMTAVSVVRTLASTVAIVLLAMAIFIDRDRSEVRYKGQ